MGLEPMTYKVTVYRSTKPSSPRLDWEFNPAGKKGFEPSLIDVTNQYFNL